MGGISNLDDALEFLIAGANALAVGTATFSNPQTMLDIVDGLQDYLEKNKLSLDDLSGSLET